MTPRHIALARHALGLADGRKQSYRNRFTAHVGAPDHREWTEMSAAGDAVAGGPNDDYEGFSLTRQGAEKALGPGESLCPEDFPS